MKDDNSENNDLNNTQENKINEYSKSLLLILYFPLIDNYKKIGNSLLRE